MPVPVDLIIRPGTADDAEGVAAVQVTTWQAAYRHILPSSYLDGLSVQDSAERWKRLLTGPFAASATRELFVSIAGGDVIGFISTGPSHDVDASGAGEVYAFYVTPVYWRQGIGRGLMQRAIDHLMASGFRQATLWVLEANAQARSFYEKAGWQADGTLQTVAPGGFEVPEVRYRRRLGD